MFGFRKTIDIITLFHKAGSPASTRVATLLKQASVAAAESANQTDAAASAAARREPFDLNITEDDPTTDQLTTILGYVGTPGIPTIVKGATTTHEAMKKFRESRDNFQRPVVVDWNNGKAIAGENESEILKLLNLSKSA